jgi:hypothetical protein
LLEEVAGFRRPLRFSASAEGSGESRRQIPVHIDVERAIAGRQRDLIDQAAQHFRRF